MKKLSLFIVAAFCTTMAFAQAKKTNIDGGAK